MTPADQFGSWAPNLDTVERVARLRSMRAIVRLSCGPRGEAFADLLRRAERDPAALEPAAKALNRLAGLDRRHVLTCFAALHRTA